MRRYSCRLGRGPKDREATLRYPTHIQLLKGQSHEHVQQKPASWSRRLRRAAERRAQ